MGAGNLSFQCPPGRLRGRSRIATLVKYTARNQVSVHDDEKLVTGLRTRDHATIGDVTVSGGVSANCSITATALKSTGTPGLKVRSTSIADIVKLWDSGTAELTQTSKLVGVYPCLVSLKQSLGLDFVMPVI